MICPHCGAQWQLPKHNSIINKTCPFCNGDMCSSNHDLDDLESVLKEMVNRFGINVLSNGDEFLSIFSKLAPSLQKEVSVLSFFVEYGIHTNLYEILISSPEEQERALQILSKKILDTLNNVFCIFQPSLLFPDTECSSKEPELDYDFKDLANGTVELTL